MKQHKIFCTIMLMLSLYVVCRGVYLLHDTAISFTWEGRAEGVVVGTRSAEGREWENIEFKTAGGTYNMYGNPIEESPNSQIGRGVTVWYDMANPSHNSLPIPTDCIWMYVISISIGAVCAVGSWLMLKYAHLVCVK